MITKLAEDKIFENIIKQIKDVWGLDLSYVKLETTEDNSVLPGKWTPGKIQIGWYKPAHMMKHELGHEVYEKHLSPGDRANYKKLLKNFTTPYLQEFEPEGEPVERFAEYFVMTLKGE